MNNSIVLCKQKTAYEMRISDWSSDVCSSDLDQPDRDGEGDQRIEAEIGAFADRGDDAIAQTGTLHPEVAEQQHQTGDRQGPQRSHHGRYLGRASCRERVCQYV